MTTLISAVVPTYNRGGLLARSVGSVIAQTHRPLELIIVDDGSVDDTPDVIAAQAALAREAGLEVQTLRQDNAGVSAARNAGMAAAHGEFIALIDDDDRWKPEKLAKQLACARETGAELVSCFIDRPERGGRAHLYPREAGNLLNGDDPAPVLSGEQSAHTISLFFTRALFERAGGFDTRLRIKEDHEWVVRAAHYARMASVPEPLGTYEHTEGSLVHVGTWERQLRNNECIKLAMRMLKEKCGHLPNWNEAAWRQRVGVEQSAFVRHHLRREDFAGARAELAEILKVAGPSRSTRHARRMYWKYRLLTLLGYSIRKRRDRWT
jgi:glycosyltransferase involved in cell wall biosynthesis